MQQETDEELMHRVKTGYLGALSILFERYQRPIYNFFLRMCNNAEASMDLTQSTFERVLKYRKSYKEDLPFRPWIYQLARNHYYDVLRRKHRRGDSVVDPETADVFPLRSELWGQGVSERQKRELQDALDQLSVEDRELILMHKFKGLSYREISKVLKTPEGNLRIRMHRAMLQLKDIFFEERKLI